MYSKIKESYILDNMEKIILASSSAQRQKYFQVLGLPFKIIPSQMEEILDESLELRHGVEKLAIQKVNNVRHNNLSKEMPWIAGADTIISLNGQVYGKASDKEHARIMLSGLQGQTHQVITAIALLNGRKNKIDCRSIISSVSFAKMGEGEIEWYLDTGEWEGVAGSYRIQGLAACFITEIQGSFSSIVGLPLREFYVMLRDNGYPYGC